MFNKKDFQNGMVIEMNDGRRRLFWNDRFIDEDGYILMCDISDDLYVLGRIDRLHIVKVFLTHDVCYFGAFLSDENLTCIWDRYNSQNFKRI